MRLQLQLRPMLFMGMCCTGCGRFLSKPKEAATEDDIENDFARAADPETVYRMTEGHSVHVCPKCHRPFKKRKAK